MIFYECAFAMYIPHPYNGIPGCGGLIFALLDIVGVEVFVEVIINTI